MSPRSCKRRRAELGRKGRTPLRQMFREPDLANVVGSLIEVASCNKTFLGARLGYWSVRRSALDYGVGQHTPPSFKGVSRLAFTARIGRAQFHRARSASKKATLAHPPASLLAAVRLIE